jgi:hypothetical protein
VTQGVTDVVAHIEDSATGAVVKTGDAATNAVRVNVVAGGSAGSGTSSPFGSPFPAAGTAAGAKDVSGNMAAFNLDAGGNLKVVTSGGGSAVSIADGADVAEGTTTDAAVVTDVAGTMSGKLRGLIKIFASVWDSVNGRLKVDGSAVTQPVSGTFWQATQPVSNAGLSNIDVLLSSRTKPADQQHTIVDSGAVTVSGSVTANAGTNLNTSALALEAGNLATIAAKDFATQTTLALIKAKTDNIPADPSREGGVLATAAKQDIGNVSLGSIDTKLTNPLPVSVASLPLPSGAATETGNLAKLIAYQQIQQQELLNAILIELRVHTFYLAESFGSRDSPDSIRLDVSQPPNSIN